MESPDVSWGPTATAAVAPDIISVLTAMGMTESVGKCYEAEDAALAALAAATAKEKATQPGQQPYRLASSPNRLLQQRRQKQGYQ